MKVSVSELKANIGKLIEIAETQDIYITKNGRQVAKLVSTKINKVEAMKSAFGVIPKNVSLDEAKSERLS
jgi:prevent-host-death family protein